MCGCKPYNLTEMLASGYINAGKKSCGHIDWVEPPVTQNPPIEIIECVALICHRLPHIVKEDGRKYHTKKQLDDHEASLKKQEHDPVNHPTHYESDAKCRSCGESIECIQVSREHSFTRGNAIKYLWRAGAKGDTVEDLKKAIWYIEDEIAQLEGRPNPNVHRLAKGGPIDQMIQRGVVTYSDTNDELYDKAVAEYAQLMDERAIHKINLDAPIKTGVKIINHPECKFEAPVEVKHSRSYSFRCDTHGFIMYMPIEKAPKHCTMYESETE